MFIFKGKEYPSTRLKLNTEENKNVSFFLYIYLYAKLPGCIFFFSCVVSHTYFTFAVIAIYVQFTLIFFVYREIFLFLRLFLFFISFHRIHLYCFGELRWWVGVFYAVVFSSSCHNFRDVQHYFFKRKCFT